MWKITEFLAVIGLLSCLIPVRADEDAKLREVVTRAIKAHGGLDKLTKFKASVSKEKGKYFGMGEGIDFTSENSIQLPDGFRIEVKSKVGDQEFTFIQVIDGKKGWVKFGDRTEEMDKDRLTEAKEEMNVANIANLACLNDKDFKLSSLGEVKVGDRPAIGIRVEHKGYRDVSLFFDKEKSLLLKTETRGKDVMRGGEEYTSTTLYEEYKNVEGMMVAHKLTIKHDDKLFVEAEVSEVKISEKLEDNAFEKP
jgi:hypothetical protein